MTRPTLTIKPADALIDVPRHIGVDQLRPGASVEISTQTQRAGALWQSRATYQADAQGRVDLNRDAPLSGSYSSVAPMGLIWSKAPWTQKTATPSTHPPTRPC